MCRTVPGFSFFKAFVAPNCKCSVNSHFKLEGLPLFYEKNKFLSSSSSVVSDVSSKPKINVKIFRSDILSDVCGCSSPIKDSGE